jgi:hypothetical protein
MGRPENDCNYRLKVVFFKEKRKGLHTPLTYNVSQALNV